MRDVSSIVLLVSGIALSIIAILYSKDQSPLLIIVIVSVALFIATFGYTIVSVRIVRQGKQALVERLGAYKRTLNPGLHFIIPWFDKIVWEDTNREQLLVLPLQETMTKDNVTLKLDALVYWQIVDLARNYYGVQDVERALVKLVEMSLQSIFGKMDMKETYSSRYKINRELLEPMDEIKSSWGIEVTRVEVNQVILPKELRKALYMERVAESQKRAALTKAETIVEILDLCGRFWTEKEYKEIKNKTLNLMMESTFKGIYNADIAAKVKPILSDEKSLNAATDSSEGVE